LKWGYYAAAGLALAGGGYAFGRYAAPDRVKTVEHETVRTVTREDTTAAERIRELSAQLETLKRDTHREVVTVVRKDGTRERHETLDTHVAETTDARRDTAIASDVHATREIQATRETTRTVTVERSRPQWFVGALVMLSPGVLRLDNPRAAMSAGVIVGRRLVGPLLLGLSVSVPLSQPVQVPSFGLSLTLEF
jgi:hypothetical protein